MMLFLVAIFILAAGIFYLGPSIFYFVAKERSYTDNVNLVVAASGNYTWDIGNPGLLKSIKLAGKMSANGKALVYIEEIEENGMRYLIFNSSRIDIPVKQKNMYKLVTGFALKENDDKKKNKKPEWIGSDKIFVNGSTTINLSEYFTDKDNDTLIYAASDSNGINVSADKELITLTPAAIADINTTITFTASDGTDSKSKLVGLIVYAEIFSESISIPALNITISETIDSNQTPIINQTPGTTQNNFISINLSYNSGTIYDANDDGEENTNGIVDLSIQGAKFGWNPDESKLCSVWNVYNSENPTLTSFCNGNSGCCTFSGSPLRKSNWSEIYYSSFGRDGMGFNNIVYARVIYYDVNLSLGSLKSEIYHSELSSIGVKFSEQEAEFSNECIETCLLAGLNKSSYRLVFELEDDAVLKIEKIQYLSSADVQNKEPMLLQNLSSIGIAKNKNAAINLSQYFADPDNNALKYDYYKMDSITILFENNTATVIPGNDFEGERLTYITANDSEKIAISNLFMINVTNANLSVAGSFIIQNSSGHNLAIIDSSGSMKIRGVLTQNTEPISNPNDFGVQGPEGNLNLVITTKGDLMIKGNLYENQSNLIATPNSFIIQNKTEAIVAYINSTGNLFLAGAFGENASFE